MKTNEVEKLLAVKYSAPDYAFLLQVRNGTGYVKETRTADAIAMSLFPSRGLEIIGFEIKVSRGDWLRELNSPKKADDVYNQCQRFYLVAGDKDVAKEGEVPKTWGLLYPRGGKLFTRKQAPLINEQNEPDRPFIGSILRNVT